MKVTSKVNHVKLKQIEQASIEALILTARALEDDLKESQTMPFDTGYLQNHATYTDDTDAKSGSVSVISDTPYARRLYYHPEYNFKHDNNPNAGGLWFEPYITGVKKDFVKKVFARHLRGKI